MFAIEAVLDIAVHGTDAAVRSTDITRRQKIPRRYLEQVLQHLVRAGILAGKRGPNGGYRLGRERRRISLGDIVRVVRTLEVDSEPSSAVVGSPLAHDVVWPIWKELREELMRKLDAVTIEELCRRARERGGRTEPPARADYAI